MLKILLGNTGLKVSKIALGGIPIMRLAKNEAVEVIRNILAMGINQWIPAGSPKNEKNTVVCRIDHSGKLLCPVALEELKDKHVELQIPKDLEDMASLLSAENKLLYSSITTLKKTITQE